MSHDSLYMRMQCSFYKIRSFVRYSELPQHIWTTFSLLTMDISGYDADSGEEEEVRLFLIDTALENSRSFDENSFKHNSVQAFLKHDDYISARATAINQGVDQDELHHTSDIDGVTIEWKNIAEGIKSEFRHFELVPKGIRSLRRFYPLVKKHIDLSSFNVDSLKVLKDAVGTQIIYDGLYETWLGFIPDCQERSTIYDFATQCRLVNQFMERLKSRFQDALKELFKRGIALETLAKNNLNDIRRIFVLPGHQCDILEMFQLAIDDTDLIELPSFKKVLFTFRFGEKCETPVKLPVRNANAVRDICVHVGHRISSDYVDMFWARQGVAQLMESNYIITSAYSFFECANLQSALSTSHLNISRDLRAVCSFPNSIRFVQLYSDLPHRYPKTRVHPVTASVIMMEGLLSNVSQRKLYEDASVYLSEIHNNFYQTERGVCRLEFVLSIGKRDKDITGAEFMRLDRLAELLENHPMIVPFLKHFSTFKLLRNVGLYLHNRLEYAFRAGRGTGNTRLAWDVYQNELAVEKLLWGRPLCSSSNQYSKNLGPGIQYPTRCITDQKGFLCLEDSGSCCVDERTLPPVYIFSKNITIQRQINNISGFYNLIGGSQLALGRRLMEILLRDCHTTGKIFVSFEQFLRLLEVKSGSANKRIVGGISVQEIVQMLSKANKFKWPFVLGPVKQLMLKMNVNVEEVIQRGINGLNLGYFPALRHHDQSRNIGMNWEVQYGYWVLTDIPDKESELERESAAIQNLVVTELEKRKLCHSIQYMGMVFPWIKVTLEKIREEKLSAESKVKILTFISCVAFLQEGRYVNFYSLNKLERDLPLTQFKLRMLEIQSPFQLPGINNVKVFRLHPSVPCKLDILRTGKDESKRTEENSTFHGPSMEDDRTEEIEPEQNEKISVEAIDSQDVQVHPVPSNQCYKKWSPAELAILATVIEKDTLTVFQKYILYRKACHNINIPDRSFESFRVKFRRF